MTVQQRQIMSGKDIDLALQRICLQILEKNSSGSKLSIIGIYTCGVHLARRLHQMIQTQTDEEVSFGSLDITLYRDDWSLISQNPVVKTTAIPFAVDDSQVILVDDVIYTGRTIRAAMDALVDYGRPSSIQLAVLIDRGGREIPIQPDFTGMVAPVQDDERIQVLMAENDRVDRVIIER